MNQVTIKNHEQGREWVRSHQELWSSPGVVLLSGPMGAGKTQICRWILDGLGSKEAASPTFAVHHRYDVETLTVDHFDLYRLSSQWDLEETGFWDILGEEDNLVLVEWADRLPLDSFPKSRRTVVVNIDLKSDGTRVLSYDTI